jgi:quercetin 2,3-dioxygenase
VIRVQRAAQRNRTDSAGITTWHCFSSGGHYDPDNVAFGPVIACDEHLVAAGAGFERHRHAHVELVSWVLDGALRHSDPAGRSTTVPPGQLQYQLAGAPIEHAEANASGNQPLRFVQVWLLTETDATAYVVQAPPLALAAGTVSVVEHAAGLAVRARTVFGFVGAGRFTVGGRELSAGDSVRASDDAVTVTGDGRLLLITVEA